MKKIKRFKSNIIDDILGKEYEEAKKICLFNGYSLLNIEEKNYSLYYINYELKNNKIVKAYFKL